MAAATNLLRRAVSPRVRQIAFAFNFTDLPTGLRAAYLRSALRGIDEYVVFSRYERALYHEVLGIPLERIRFLHWAMDPPTPGSHNPVPIEIRKAGYICAIGGEGRDYKTLADALRLTPQVQAVVVARPKSLEGIEVPPNMIAFTNLPLDVTWRIASDSLGMVVSLLSDTTACGHITVVGAQLLGIPLVATRSQGLEDYTSEATAILAPHGSGELLAGAIGRLVSFGIATKDMAARALIDAEERSSLVNWVEYFKEAAMRLQGSSNPL